MKSVTSLTFGILASVAMANPNYVNTVRQVQLDTGLEWDVTVAPLGEMVSPEYVSSIGTDYELWTLNAISGQSTFLDSQFASLQTPSGQIEIITGDPYSDHPRTRIDKPFTVQKEVENLITEDEVLGLTSLSSLEEAPISSRQVDFEHRIHYMPTGTNSVDRISGEGELIRSLSYTQNAAHTESHGQSNLLGNVSGQEVFSLYTAGDEHMPSMLLDEKVLRVWPMAKASINGIESSSEEEHPEVSSIPPLTIALTDLYPDSNTYLRIYQGEQSANPEDPIEINDADLTIYDEVPQDRTWSLSDIGSMMEGGGIWTIEVIHVTPWGAESLTHISPDLNSSIKVRAGLFTK